MRVVLEVEIGEEEGAPPRGDWRGAASMKGREQAARANEEYRDG